MVEIWVERRPELRGWKVGVDETELVISDKNPELQRLFKKQLKFCGIDVNTQFRGWGVIPC